MYSYIRSSKVNPSCPIAYTSIDGVNRPLFFRRGTQVDMTQVGHTKFQIAITGIQYRRREIDIHTATGKVSRSFGEFVGFKAAFVDSLDDDIRNCRKVTFSKFRADGNAITAMAFSEDQKIPFRISAGYFKPFLKLAEKSDPEKFCFEGWVRDSTRYGNPMQCLVALSNAEALDMDAVSVEVEY